VTFDALFKRYFMAVVLLLTAVIAFLQAKGTTQLIGAALGVDERALSPAPTALPPMPGLEREHRTADAIIDRNPFDSTTSLKVQPPQEGLSSQPDLSDPLSAPGCDGVKVFIVTESTDPTWSVAALQGPSEPRPVMRRVGDEISGKQVAFIGFNPRQASPAVWMTGGGSLCQALLFATQPVLQPAPSPAANAAASGDAAAASEVTARTRGAAPVPADIASKIQKVSDTEYNVDRSVVDKILENQAELMRSARIVPEQRDGKVVGVRLFGIRPNTLLGTLGFQNGDRLETVNGFNMSSPEKALEAYARLRTAPNLNVKVSRRGQPVSIDYRIK
jgi:general secretion pathway protein C